MWDFSPTILERCVLHSVGAVSLVGDEGVGVGAGGVDNANLHVISSNLVEGAGINNEVGCDFSEDPWKEKSPGGYLLAERNKQAQSC